MRLVCPGLIRRAATVPEHERCLPHIEHLGVALEQRSTLTELVDPFPHGMAPLNGVALCFDAVRPVVQRDADRVADLVKRTCWSLTVLPHSCMADWKQRREVGGENAVALLSWFV